MSDPQANRAPAAPTMPQAVLDGRRVRLRAVAPHDYDWLFQLNSMPELAHRWRGRPGSLNPSQVAEFLWNNVHCQFVITRKRDGRPLGLVVAYGADLPNRTVRFGIVFDPQFHSVGWPLEAAALFIDYLFETSDFRKLYSEAVDYNLQSYQSALDNGIVHMEGASKRTSTARHRAAQHVGAGKCGHQVDDRSGRVVEVERHD